jgi:hypothetical protein
VLGRRITPRAAWTGIGEVERCAGFSAAGRARGFRRHRHLSAAQRARDTRRVGILAGIEGIAAMSVRRHGHDLFLHDGRLASPLIGRRLTVAWARLHGRSGGYAGRRGSRLQLLQLQFEHPIPVLQFLVLSGQRSQLLFQLLNADFRVAEVGLREGV